MRPVNLLPAKHRPRAMQGARQGSANLVIGALAAVLLLAVFYVLTANQANTRKTESAAAAAEAQKAETEAARLGSFGNFSQIKTTRVASVKLLSATRVDWERVMRELAHVLPARLYLKQLDASASGAPSDDSGGGGEGGGDTPDPDAAPEGPGIKMTGCSPSQRRVATLLVRLRQLHQVDDVELKESRRDIEEGGAGNPAAGAADANGAAGAGGTDESCAPDYRFEVLVKFKPDTTVKEAAEGPNEIPSTLGGGS